MKSIAPFALVVALVVAVLLGGCGGSSNVSSHAATPPKVSISQLKSEAAAEHRVAEAHLRAAMRAYNPQVSHSEQVQQLKLSNEARQRTIALHQQLCELVLQDPRTTHSDWLGKIALTCE